MFGFNPSSADYVGPIIVENSSGSNIDEKALVWMPDPPKGWANPDDCGNFPCTSYNNTF